MPTVQEPHRLRATERLGQLEGWADFVCEALHAPLGAPVEERTLRELRELSWALRDKLHVLRTRLELSP